MSTGASYEGTVDELIKLDASYRTILTFREWERGTPDVQETWVSYVRRFEEVRHRLSEQRQLELVHAALRGAAVNTGAIEGLHDVTRGLTFTVMTVAAGWQQAVTDSAGPTATEFVEAALQGYEMALDLATKQHQISEAWIRRIHEVVCAPQKTYRVLTQAGWQDHLLSLGSYKDQRNHVLLPDGSLHAYAPVDLTSHEMHRLTEQIQSEDFQKSHPALQAAYSHHALTTIHPFSDGNGRVARVLASVFTLRAAGVPLVILDEHKPLYFGALERADGGNRETFVYFVADRVVDILGYLVETTRADVENITDFVRRLTELLTGQGGLPLQEVDAVAWRALGALGRRAFERAGSYTLPKGVAVSMMNSSTQPGGKHPDGQFRLPSSPSPGLVSSGFLLNAGAPLHVEVHVQLAISIRKDRDHRYPFFVTATTHAFAGGVQSGRSQDTLEVRLDEVYPELTNMFLLRSSAWLDGLVRGAFELLVGGVASLAT